LRAAPQPAAVTTIAPFAGRFEGVDVLAGEHPRFLQHPAVDGQGAAALLADRHVDVAPVAGHHPGGGPVRVGEDGPHHAAVEQVGLAGSAADRVGLPPLVARDQRLSRDRRQHRLGVGQTELLDDTGLADQRAEAARGVETGQTDQRPHPGRVGEEPVHQEFAAPLFFAGAAAVEFELGAGASTSGPYWTPEGQTASQARQLRHWYICSSKSGSSRSIRPSPTARINQSRPRGDDIS
jgi:hypothetical protein